jgi:hypothetical protein
VDDKFLERMGHELAGWSDPAARLREALEMLAEDGALRQRLGAQAFAVARDRFDAGRNNSALLQTLREAAERGPNVQQPSTTGWRQWC